MIYNIGMKKKYIWLTEILIWLLILSAGLYYFIYESSIKENAKNTYYIFVDDAAGMIKGSSVRLMGIDIGYVRDVKIFDNKVFISFLVTKEGIKLPKRAIASIEFYGLGGSTSMELTPDLSENEEAGEIIKKGKSYRVQDFWNGQVAVADVMINIYGSFGRMAKKTDLVNHKDMFKQSKLIQEINEKTGQVNSSQSVIIYKMTENILNHTQELPPLPIEEDEQNGENANE